MIQTQIGPVGLRRGRDPQKIVLHGSKRPVEVKKGWIQRDKSAKADEGYRPKVMQAMLVGVTEIEIEDLAANGSVDPATGLQRTPEQTRRYSQELQKKLEMMQRGTTPVQLKRLSVGAGLTQQKHGGRELVKHCLMKRSNKMGSMRSRYFNIDNGKLKEFKYHHDIKVAHHYELHNCECCYEDTTTLGVTEVFPSGYGYRVKVQVVERPHGPLFLYAEDARMAKSWERAIKMSKYLQSPSDREAISFVVGRLAGSVMQKGWAALFEYAREIDNTRKLVKNFSMRLMRVDDSRGWTKLRMVYLSLKESERRKLEGRKFATSFLKERMEKITTQNAREPRQVRHMIVAQMQTKFRQYRQEKIFDRMYPLGSHVVTRMQQALSGADMGACFESLTYKDALQLTLDTASFLQLVNREDVRNTKKARYSEVQVPVSQLSVSVSESLTMLSFAEMDEAAENMSLAKAGWAHYVSLDQISSVVLHTERMMGKEGKRHELSPSMCGGAWFTINGPRVCWGRKIRSIVDPKTKEETRMLVGTADGQAVGTALARGERVRMFRCVVTIKGCNIFRPESDPEELLLDEEVFGQDGRPLESSGSNTAWQTYMVIHILGRRFRTNTVSGNNPTYTGAFQAEVPVSPASNEQAATPSLSALDESEVAIDIVQWDRNPKKHKTVWAGKMPLWKLFGPDENIVERSKNATQTLLGMEQEEVEEVVSLSQTLGRNSGRAVKTIKMVYPGMTGTDQLVYQGSVEVEVSAGIRIAESNERRVISPELQGRGAITTLFSSHKAAWFDPKLGEGNFISDQTANFVELAFKELSFPETDRAVDRLIKYQIVVRLKGIQAATIPLHRAKDAWKFVIPADTRKINFQGTKVWLPIPPGAWCAEAASPEERLQVEITVQRCLQDEAPALSLAELSKSNGKAGPSPQTWERCYHARAYLEGLPECEDRTRRMNMPLSKINTQPCKVLLGSGQHDTVDDGAWIWCEAALRDRDYVQMRDRDSILARGQGRGESAQGMGQGCVLCVGDKAMLRVEEPLVYPKEEVEFRRRFIPGVFEARKQQAGWVAPLRDPSLSHEYAASKLDKLDPPPPFKQKYLPTHSDDIIPHKYVLPQSEQDFMKEARPGVYWRIVEHLAAQEVQRQGQNKNPPDQHTPAVVTELSHLMRHAPSIVLAVYANGTCDVEIAPSFIAEWEKHPDKRYTIPGAVVIKEFKDTSTRAIRDAPVGAGDVGDRNRLRVILRDVPLGSLISVQTVGFNVYDASFGTVEDAIKVHPADCGNDFNPRLGDIDEPSFQSARRGTYAIHAGPLPMDAGASCQYEWQLHLQAPTEDDMYHFVTNLRQSVRMNLFQEALKLEQYERKSNASRHNNTYSLGPIHSTKSGHLEVVLVEARHLRPPMVQKDFDMQKSVERAVEAELNCLVAFKLRNGPDGEELLYRGSKTQFSPQIPGDDPSWAEMKENKTSGGWVFRSPPIDPAQHPELEILLEVKHKGSKTIGYVLVPVAGDGSSTPREDGKGLCDADRPFRNMWKPLMKLDAETGQLTTKTSGEIHIMTLWTPQQQTERSKRLPKSAKAWQTFELKPKLYQPLIREPLYDTPARKTYNPNIQKVPRHPFPSTRHDAMAKHIESYEGIRMYLDCTDGQAAAAWDKFDARLLALWPVDREDPPPSLGQFRERWALDKDRMLWELTENVRRGIPPERRNRTWIELTRALDEIAQVEGAGEFGGVDRKSVSAPDVFHKLVESNRSLAMDAMYQLHEDTVSASAWEQSTIPAVCDMHLDRLKRAQDVCIGLIAFSLDDPKKPGCINWKNRKMSGVQQSGQIAYCEGLLAVAYHLVVALEGKNKKTVHTVGDAKVKEDKARAFWILYSISCSTSNMQFRDYYGRPSQSQHLRGEHPPIIDRQGPMDDVYRLGIILARLEPEVNTTMNSLGFHLSTVFCGGFGRLFAFMMPTASLFRFWDLLFSDDWKPPQQDHPPRQKPPRHSLLDLAFGALRHPDLKPLILACCSAMEVKDCILNFFESLYDPSQVIQIAVDAERDLWEYSGANLVAPLHVKDYHRAVHWWDAPPQPTAPPGHLFQYRRQNLVLTEVAYSSSAVPEAGAQVDPRLTTKNVILQIIPALQKVCSSDGAERSKFAGMMRMIPQRIREIGPELDQTTVGQLWSWATRLAETVVVEDMSVVMALGLPPFPLRPEGEPTHMDSTELAKIVSRAGLGKAWESNNLTARIFEAFVSPWQRRMSLNEFFVALICCSKGTVGEKAMGLFHLYGHSETHSEIGHVTRESHAAHTIIDTIESGKSAVSATQLARPPKPAAIVDTTTLHFKIYTATIGSLEDVLGEVFVPSLRPYFYSGTGSMDKFQNFAIWGQEMELPPGAALDAANEDGRFRPQIGTVSMGIKWMTQKGSGREEVGQLGIHLQHIKFQEKYVEAPQWKNPRITVHMYDDKGEEKFIKRWDPRSGTRKMGAAVTMDVYGGGAFGEHLEWEHTMRRNPITGTLAKRHGIREPHGWDAYKQIWVWARKWGNQESEPGLQVKKDLMKSAAGPAARSNMITLQACRYITKSILSRGLCTVTNRQAALIADQIFNRAGVVPGIIDALVVSYDQRHESHNSVQTLRQECDSMNRSYVDVRQQLIMAHETSVDLNRGDLTLFPSQRVDQNGPSAVTKYNFADLKIADPFPGQQKMLWVRYIRAGDGVRQTVKIKVEQDGGFMPMDLHLDMDMDSRSGNVQMSITKHEFVTCIMASPTLSEVLRKLTTTDTRVKDIKDVLNVKLEVIIADPTGEDEDDDLMDALNIRQRVLLEVWDSDFPAKDDFLGECWLPPLNQLSAQPKQFVLPVENQAEDDGGGQYSRNDSKKKLGTGKKCTGNLFIEASWNFPSEDVGQASDSVKDRVAFEKKKHTGELTIRIIKAENLRSADSKLWKGMAGSDPYVKAFVQNECYKGVEKERTAGMDKWGWRVGEVATMHDHLLKTNVHKNTLSPEWNETFKAKLMTGRFEQQTKTGGSFDIMHRKANAANQTNTILSGGGDDLRIYFGADQRQANISPEAAQLKIPASKSVAEYKKTPGYRHEVTIHLGDTLHQFKKKLQLACNIEADIERKELVEMQRRNANDPACKQKQRFIAMLEAVRNTMGFSHAVMAFSASQKLREMRMAGNDKTTAFSTQWKLEHADPSSWQPMDPSCTFAHYTSFGFGFSHTVQLRVCEGTSDYKLRNSRFRAFEEENAKWAARPEDLNTETQCWGYVNYTHPDGSTEWRQAIVERLEEHSDSAKRSYQATFVQAPLLLVHGGEDYGRLSATQLRRQQKLIVEEDALLLGPPNPKIRASANLEHVEFLAKARQLQDDGRTEAEIVAILNVELRKKWQQAQEAEEKAGGTAHAEVPHTITAGDVRHALQVSEAAAVTGPAGGAPPSKTSALKAAMMRR